MSLLHLTFVPMLDFWSADDEGRVLLDRYPTTDKEMDAALEASLLSDRIDFTHAFLDDQWDAYHYQFDPNDNLIHLVVRNPTGGNMSVDILKEAVDVYGPSAADT